MKLRSPYRGFSWLCPLLLCAVVVVWTDPSVEVFRAISDASSYIAMAQGVAVDIPIAHARRLVHPWLVATLAPSIGLDNGFFSDRHHKSCYLSVRDAERLVRKGSAAIVLGHRAVGIPACLRSVRTVVSARYLNARVDEFFSHVLWISDICCVCFSCCRSCSRVMRVVC